jgi:hypothetical protein
VSFFEVYYTLEQLLGEFFSSNVLSRSVLGELILSAVLLGLDFRFGAVLSRVGYVSRVQSELHPSPAATLASSHCSPCPG